MLSNQLNKGIIELFLLLLLKKEDNYGYKLAKISADNLNIGEGAVYPVLRRLAKSGYLDRYNKLENKREKKFYQLNQSGQEYLNYLLSEWEIIAQAINKYV